MNAKTVAAAIGLLFVMVVGTAALLGGPSDLQAAQDVADDAVAAEQDRAARDSRAWVLQGYQRNVCSKSGQIAIWLDDKTPGCVREWRNP